LNNIERHLQQLERDLLSPAIRRNSEIVSLLLADEFREFGSSGNSCDKEQTLKALASEPPAEWSVADFRVFLLAANVALVTYRATRHDPSMQQSLVSLRSSVWLMRDARWQMVFHQGTKVAA